MDLQKQAGMNLVLSTDAKPRLKWTPELHQRFAEAVTQLGGPDKATPKSLMRVMGIPGLTLYHLKSHLQKFRMGKSQQPEALSNNKEEDGKDNQSSDSHCSRDISGEAYSQNQVNENLQIAEAIQIQMEVQRKLHEQIEVQRRLQLRIEAQGKYLHSVLRKAQETLVQYSSSSVSIETAKAELSRLVSIISNACPGSPLSELTETRVINFNDVKRKIEGTISSLGSSLTSSESSERKVEKQPMIETGDPQVSYRTPVVELPLMAINSPDKTVNGNGSSQHASGRKRNGVINSVDGSTDQPFEKRSGNKLRRYELSQMLDLNRQYQSHDIHSGTKTLDLNCEGTEHFVSGTF